MNENQRFHLFNYIERDYEYFLKHNGVIGDYQAFFMTGLGHALNNKNHWMWDKGGLKL